MPKMTFIYKAHKLHIHNENKLQLIATRACINYHNRAYIPKSNIPTGKVIYSNWQWATAKNLVFFMLVTCKTRLANVKSIIPNETYFTWCRQQQLRLHYRGLITLRLRHSLASPLKQKSTYDFATRFHSCHRAHKSKILPTLHLCETASHRAKLCCLPFLTPRHFRLTMKSHRFLVL